MTAPVSHPAHLEMAGARGRRIGLSEVLVGVAAVLLFAAIYGRLMGYGLRRDEMMFVPPAVLLESQRLYADFFFNHTPYSAWYFRGLHLVFGGAGLLFAARLGVFLGWIGLAAATAGVVWALTRSRLVAVFALVGLLTCHALLNEPGMAATDNLLQLPFATLGMGLFLIETTGTSPRFWRLAMAGASVSVAIGIKISAATFAPPIAIAAVLMPAGLPLAARLRRVLLPLVIGGVIGALPLFWYLAADPGLFIAHVLKFHLGPHVAYWQANQHSEPDLALGLGGKLRIAYATWLEGAPLVMAVVILSLGWSASRPAVGRRRAGKAGLRRPILYVLATLALTMALSLLPTPGFPQYYILPLASLPLLAALAYRQLGEDGQEAMRPVLGAATVVMLVLAAPWLAPGLTAIARPDGTTPAATARGGAELRRALETYKPAGEKVATFLPIYPLEAGLPVYPEFATGQFAYRIAPFTAPELAAEYRMVGAEGIAALFDADPPAAMVLGYEPGLEAPMLRYAETHGYTRVEVPGLDNRYGSAIVFLNLGGAAQ
jgi:hypothetical protein